jgi:excinuclease UvrABC helicase subunit UvrB
MNFRKNQPLINLFETLFTDKEKFESFYNQITNNLTPTLGTTKTETGTNEDGSKWYRTTFTSNDGSYTSTNYVSSTSYNNYWYPTATNTPTSTDELSTLKNSLNKAIDSQNFEEAVRLRDLIKEYEKNSEKVSDLKYKLEQAVSSQNYEEAIKLRDSIKKIETK